MKKTNFIQVDMNNAIMCSELEDLARRVDNLIKGAGSGIFRSTLGTLKLNLLSTSKMIKQGTAIKQRNY